MLRFIIIATATARVSQRRGNISREKTDYLSEPRLGIGLGVRPSGSTEALEGFSQNPWFPNPAGPQVQK